MQEQFDVAVVGGGPAGMAAALYTSRAKLATVIIESNVFGGQVAVTGVIENYPGFTSIPGTELAQRMHEAAMRFGAAERIAEVEAVLPGEGGRFVVRTSTGSLGARSVIVATGCRHRTLGVPGEKEFQSRGVSYCAVCDGPFYEGADVVVVGGGDSALQEAAFLSQYASSVTIVHRRQEFRASTSVQEKARHNPKLRFVLGRVVEEIRGDDGVQEVALREVGSGKVDVLPAEGVFIYVGMEPSTEFLRGALPLSGDGLIATDQRMRTVVPGLFAAGDVRAKTTRQIATAVGEGVEAALAAAEFVREA
ncbi:MAG: thioredoxin-disulfide reductase [Chloroflexi bacterium]|nr:thioredoxin-disulfide reductase [Chloroflexota bacterium]